MRKIIKVDKNGKPLPVPVLMEGQTWEHSCQYDKGEVVNMYGESFVCEENHESNIFGNDLFDKRLWNRI